MIDDEALHQIEALPHSDRPLIVCDVDEVVLEFVEPFMDYLNSRGFGLKTETWRLTGSVYEMSSGDFTPGETVRALLSDFFAVQDLWQKPVSGALDGLSGLGDIFDVVLLTAMPHAHRALRSAFMRNLGFHQPLMTVESDKGPSVARLASVRPHLAFIDDLAHNHHSVAQHVPEARRYQIMAFRGFGADMPVPPPDTPLMDNWPALAAAIVRDLG